MLDTKEKVIESIVKNVPYPDQISNWDVSSEKDAVRFTWRGSIFRVGVSTLFVNEVEGSMLTGTDKAILMKRIISFGI